MLPFEKLTSTSPSHHVWLWDIQEEVVGSIQWLPNQRSHYFEGREVGVGWEGEGGSLQMCWYKTKGFIPVLPLIPLLATAPHSL